MKDDETVSGVVKGRLTICETENIAVTHGQLLKEDINAVNLPKKAPVLLAVLNANGKDLRGVKLVGIEGQLGPEALQEPGQQPPGTCLCAHVWPHLSQVLDDACEGC